MLIISADFEPLNTRERLERLGMAAARLWQPIEALACTQSELTRPDRDTVGRNLADKGERRLGCFTIYSPIAGFTPKGLENKKHFYSIPRELMA